MPTQLRDVLSVGYVCQQLSLYVHCVTVLLSWLLQGPIHCVDDLDPLCGMCQERRCTVTLKPCGHMMCEGLLLVLSCTCVDVYMCVYVHDCMCTLILCVYLYMYVSEVYMYVSNFIMCLSVHVCITIVPTCTYSEFSVICRNLFSKNMVNYIINEFGGLTGYSLILVHHIGTEE